MELGFLDYLNDVRSLPDANDTTLIFPFLNPNNVSDVPSQRFTADLRALDIHQTRVKTFYSFRHTLNGKFKEKGVSMEWRSMFIGHEVDEVNFTTYGDETPVERLAQIVLPALDWGLPWHKVKANRAGIKQAITHLVAVQENKAKLREKKERHLRAVAEREARNKAR
jgi:hypothetical protein